MRRVRFLAVALLLATSSARAQRVQRVQRVQRAGSADERALYRLEDSWATALVRRDSMPFVRLLAAGYVYTDERGVFTKRQVVDETFRGTDTVSAASNEEMKAHVYGAAAVVTGILVTRGRGKDGPFAHRYRYTDSWVRRGGRWIMIASQDYDIPAR